MKKGKITKREKKSVVGLGLSQCRASGADQCGHLPFEWCVWFDVMSARAEREIFGCKLGK